MTLQRFEHESVAGTSRESLLGRGAAADCERLRVFRRATTLENVLGRTFLRVAFPALAIAGAVAACSSASNSAFNSDAQKSNTDTSGKGASEGFTSSDAAVAPTSERPDPTSPLCGSSSKHAECFPDDSASCAPDVDAGSALDDASTKATGCRIGKAAKDDQEDSYGTYAPACSLADRAGTDGVACSTGADCAPGFDCVTSEKGAVCRRYCCSGSCEDHSSQNGGSTFCDIQTLVDHEHAAPVCMPLKACKLFADGDCSTGETCAVVTEDGSTGCVVNGKAKVGEPCDEERCEGGLTCLGFPGDRVCYKLCRIDGSECTATQTCTPASLFHDMKTGVCKD